MAPSVNETDGILVMRASLNNASAQPASVSYSTSDLTATGGAVLGNDVDYLTVSNQTLNIPAGSSYAEFPIHINNDFDNEGSETFAVTFSNATNAQFSGGASSITATATIVDDEVAGFIGCKFNSKV